MLYFQSRDAFLYTSQYQGEGVELLALFQETMLAFHVQQKSILSGL